MRTVTEKTTTNPVKPTKLGVIMKAQVRSRIEDIQPTVSPKTTLINAPKASVKATKKAESIVPPRWISACAPRDSPFRLITTRDPKISTSFNGVRPKPIQERSILDKSYEIQVPP